MSLKHTPLAPFGLLLEAQRPELDLREIQVETLREHFKLHHLLVLRGFKTFSGSEEFSNYCEAWGEVSVWPFGKVLELIEQENPVDHIFDHSYVPLHWDGMYRPQVPEYQIFHCVQAPPPGQGGRTTFSHTSLALQRASAASVDLWQKVTGRYKRKMEFYQSETISPIVTRHPFTGAKVIRYNEPPSPEQGSFVNPPELEFTGVELRELDFFHKSLTEALYAPENFYAHEWQTGDVVIADNFTLLHGREGFVSKSPRHLQRVHVLSDPPFNNPGLESYQ